VTRRRKLTLQLRSPLSLDECLKRLHDACDEEALRVWGYAGYRGSRPVIGRFDGPRFTLHKRTYWPWHRGPIEPTLLSGRLVAAPEGTRLEGGVRTPWGARLGFLVALAAGVTALVLDIERHTPMSAPWFPALFFGGAAVAAIVGDLWRVRRERAFLTAFVRDLLQARDERIDGTR
jgi:hypothetical protein